MAFADSIIAAVNTAAANSGFAGAVLSTSAEVLANIMLPDTVVITLPPSPCVACILRPCAPRQRVRQTTHSLLRCELQ